MTWLNMSPKGRHHTCSGGSVIQVFTHESPKIGHTIRKQKPSSELVFISELINQNHSWNSYSSITPCLTEGYASAHHIQVCLWDGCISDVTTHQCDTDWLPGAIQGAADAKARRQLGAGPKAVADSFGWCLRPFFGGGHLHRILLGRAPEWFRWTTGKETPQLIQVDSIFGCQVFWMFYLFLSKTESSVQSLSRVRLFATPWIAARQASLSITNSRSLLKLIFAHRVGDAIQPSHPLSSPPPPAPNPSQHQGLFQWVNSSHEVAKYWSFSFSISPCNEHPGLISFRMD